MVAGQTGSLEVVGSVLGNVRFGSITDRFTPKSGHRLSASGRLLCAKSRHSMFIRLLRRRGQAMAQEL
jgi:hypothetical protein